MKFDQLVTLKRAKALIDTPEKWAQGSFATNKDRCYVSTSSVEAVCFCSIGAIHRVLTDDKPVGMDLLTEYCFGDKRDAVVKHLAKHIHTDHHSVMFFNDDKHTTHSMVMQMWDGAIAELEHTHA